MSYKVFVSYSWKNSAEVRALSAEIKKIKEVELLIDTEQILPGWSVHGTISELIDKANCVVGFLTKDGLQSKEVLDEISRAHDRDKDIIPVVSKGTEMISLPWYIRELNWISYDDRNFDAVLQAIIRAINERVNHVPHPPVPPPVPPPVSKLPRDTANAFKLLTGGIGSLLGGGYLLTPWNPFGVAFSMGSGHSGVSFIFFIAITAIVTGLVSFIGGIVTLVRG